MLKKGINYYNYNKILIFRRYTDKPKRPKSDKPKLVRLKTVKPTLDFTPINISTSVVDNDIINNFKVLPLLAHISVDYNNLVSYNHIQFKLLLNEINNVANESQNRCQILEKYINDNELKDKYSNIVHGDIRKAISILIFYFVFIIILDEGPTLKVKTSEATKTNRKNSISKLQPTIILPDNNLKSTNDNELPLDPKFDPKIGYNYWDNMNNYFYPPNFANKSYLEFITSCDITSELTDFDSIIVFCILFY